MSEEGLEGIPQSALMPKPLEVTSPTLPTVEIPAQAPAVIKTTPAILALGEQAQPKETPIPQQDEKPGLFRMIRNTVQNTISSYFNRDQQPDQIVDTMKNTQISRRTLLKGALGLGAAASLEITAEKFFPSFTARALAERILKHFQKDTILQNLHTKWEKQDQLTSTYLGEHIFELPAYSDLNEYQLTSEEHTTLLESIKQSETFLQHKFGSAPAWRKNTITYITINDSVLKSYNQQGQDAYVIFADGKLNDKNYSNLIVLNHEVISEMTTENKESEDSLFHEMSHAYNDNPNLPIMWNEGRAEMTEELLAQDKDPEIHPFMMKARRTMMENINAIDKLRNVSYTTANDLTVGLIYNAAGVLFFDWQQEHPNFFPALRQLENSFYTANSRLPSADEWAKMGDQIEPGFKSWIESQPVLNIPK